jgi:hypothetical protein
MKLTRKELKEMVEESLDNPLANWYNDSVVRK